MLGMYPKTISQYYGLCSDILNLNGVRNKESTKKKKKKVYRHCGWDTKISVEACSCSSKAWKSRVTKDYYIQRKSINKKIRRTVLLFSCLFSCL